MRQLVRFPLETGDGDILVEVEDEGGTIPVGAPIRVAAVTFEKALDTITPALKAVVQKVQSLADLPESVVVEVGVKLHADAGALLASAGGEANIKVAFTWKPNRRSPEPR